MSKQYPWFVKVTETGAVIKRPMIIPTDLVDRLKQMEDFEVTGTYPKGPDIFLEALTPIELTHLRRKAQHASNKLLSLDLFVHCNAVTGAHGSVATAQPLTSECRTEPKPTENEINVHVTKTENGPVFEERKHPISLKAALGFDEHPILIVHPAGCARAPAINDNVVRLVHEIRKLDGSRKIVIQAYDERQDGPTRSFMAELLCSGICIRVLAGSMVYEKLRGHEDPIGASVTF